MFSKVERIKRRFHKKLEQMNQPVYFRDLFVFATGASSFAEFDSIYGEHQYPSAHTYHTRSEKEYFPIERLIDHIVFLAGIANTYHQYYNCTKDVGQSEYSLKKDSLNKITRLLLPEFSLYSYKALTMEQYHLLIEQISLIAKKQHENVHLLLSSLPVVFNQEILLNTVIYVECGSEPKIHAFCKRNAFRDDLTYPKVKTYTVPNSSHYTASLSNTQSGNLQGAIISTNSVFYIKTAGGAQYIQAVDICFDHLKKNALRLIQYKLQETKDLLMPTAVSYIVTSTTIKLSHSFCTSVSHIDRNACVSNWERGRRTKFKAQLDEMCKSTKLCTTQERAWTSQDSPIAIDPKVSDKLTTFFGKYKGMEIKEGKRLCEELYLFKPPFGANCSLALAEEKQINGFNELLNADLMQQNITYIEEYIRFILNQLTPMQVGANKPLLSIEWYQSNRS